MDYLHQIPRIRDGLDHFLENDPVFSTLDVKPEQLTWPYYGPGFASLARIVIGQQVSTQAADALWKRFEDGLPCITPNAVMVLKDEEMRALGLSHQKASYIRNLAEAIRQKSFDPMALEHMDDSEVFETITSLKGFGAWSAQIYLMFGLARPDIWPSGDLGIQEGVKRYLGLEERPQAMETLLHGNQFKPYRTAASLLFWYLKSLKNNH